MIKIFLVATMVAGMSHLAFAGNTNTGYHCKILSNKNNDKWHLIIPGKNVPGPVHGWLEFNNKATYYNLKNGQTNRLIVDPRDFWSLLYQTRYELELENGHPKIIMTDYKKNYKGYLLTPQPTSALFKCNKK